ncbi:putative LRAT-like domain-containing protein [Rosa chinensis]|uniref:Putative LRAT-like domain-containing protein n=1 Tax=Rosa chinensis TaxID=74649 RepID=A0A2P6SPQ4_ROSCH|nr:protein LEAD-SENSITIVE 1 isoform X2 [Rosa chinensis]PRQ60661.1 putative LRAT-like domain-containing protein [Rosa chinensis]
MLTEKVTFTPTMVSTGIFVGNDTVIHFNRTQERDASRGGRPCRKCGVDKDHLRGVVKSCVDCFLNGRHLHRFRYSVGPIRFVTNVVGTCTTGNADPPDVTISRANGLFDRQDFGDYDLALNNCETFAVFCKTGVRSSDQARSALSLIDAALERLYNDVLVHHGQEKLNELMQVITRFLGDEPSQQGVGKLNKFKQKIDWYRANRWSPDQISDGLRNLEIDQGDH